MVQDHAPARRNNSIRAGIEEDPGWDDPALVWVTNVPACGEGVQGKKCSLKNVTLAVNWKVQKSQNKSAANHFAMTLAENTKGVNAHKGK